MGKVAMLRSNEVSVRETTYPAGLRELGATIYSPPAGRVLLAVLDVHGGGWAIGNRHSNVLLDTALAEAGVVVLAVDVRSSREAPYPASVEDVSHAISWARKYARDHLGVGAKLGALGTSSGGHLVLLNALTPKAFELSARVDSSEPLDAVVACYPVTDPLARYRYALNRGHTMLIEAHDAFFAGGERQMSAANPQLLLEAGRATNLPPILLIQGTADNNVTRRMARRFHDTYTIAGGEIESSFYPNMPHAFLADRFSAHESQVAVREILGFLVRHCCSVS